MAGVCDRWSHHEFAEDSSHNPSDVKAIMTASIQYCERVAVRFSLNVTQRAIMRQDKARHVPADERPTWTYQMPVAEIQA